MSKNAATETDAQRHTDATNTFNSLFSRPEATDAVVTPAYTSTGGVRYTIGKNVVATSSSPLLPLNWTQVIKVSPGEQLSAVSNDGVAGTVVVVELDN